MSQMKLVFATSSCMVQVGPGNNVQIQEGDVWRASDPLVRAHRNLFTDDPRGVIKTSGVLSDDDEGDAVAEQATVDKLTKDLEASNARVSELESEANAREAEHAEADEEAKRAGGLKTTDVEPQAPVEQATKAPGEKRPTRRATARGK